MEYIPLTRPQRQIEQLERFAPGAATITTTALFRGALDEPAMQRALNRLTQAADISCLRVAPQGRQFFVPCQEQVFPVVRFESAAQLHAWAAAKALEPLDMTGPLYQFTIVILPDAFGVFSHTHHLIVDAWTSLRVVSLLNHEYYNPESGAAAELPAYRDYIEKETQYLQSGQFARDREYWLGQFPAAPTPCFLSRATGLAAARHDVFLAPEQARPLRDFAAARGLSPLDLMMTALAAYLLRVCGQTELCIGTTTLGRPSIPFKRTLGMFAATLAIPIRIDPNAGFLQNAQALKGTLLGALRHEGFGYMDLLAELKRRDGFDGRLYDVLCNYQNATVSGMDEHFLGTRWYPAAAQPETLQLQMDDRDNTGGLTLLYDYHTAALSSHEIRLLHKRLMTLLRDAIANPETPVKQLELLCDEDHALWGRLNQSEHDIPLRPVYRYLEEQACQNPRQTAVIFDHTELSYENLNAWANRIAAFLRGRHIKPGSVVAIRTERCLELIPLLFGIMKAGCAYLPILPDWPQARVQFILQDGGAALLVSQPDGIITEACCPMVTMRDLHDLPDCDFESCNDTSQLAYVMYTSGSTGQPKGVRVTQAGLCNRLLWMEAAYPLSPGETLIQKTSYAFDVSAWELFWPFMQGRALLLPEPGAQRQPRRLAELIRQYHIRTCHFVPSMLSLFLDDFAAAKQPLPSLERVIVSGEALSPAMNQRFYKLFAHTNTRLYNLYGPTECTVDVLFYNCQEQDSEIPIGRPVWNTKAYVLDANGRLLPPGEQGELCIAGVQLARGYANPALDKGRFEEHPAFGRIYQTGDICSLRADGEILYHGRADGQIKIRGQRAELGEIERRLELAPGVLRAAALYENSRLHAFYCAEGDLDENNLTQYLCAHLPDYMIPDDFHRIAALPLNANGKLDRKALPEILNNQLAQPPDPEKNMPPATEQERQLLAAARAHLGGPVRMDDPPARCGLSSLDIVSIALELEAQGLRLQVNDFYAAANFHELALRAKMSEEMPMIVQLQEGENLTCFVGIPYGGGSFSAWADVAQALPGMPFFAAQTGHIDPEALLYELRQLPYDRFAVLGSCAGCGLAIDLARRLDAENRLALLCVAASVPPAFVRFYGRWYRPWRRSPAHVNRAIQKLNARKIHLGARDVANLQADAAAILRLLARNRRIPLRAPVQLIYGACDPMLRGANVRRRWERLFGKPVEEYVIPGAMHDIVHTNAEMIASCIAAAQPPH